MLTLMILLSDYGKTNRICSIKYFFTKFILSFRVYCNSNAKNSLPKLLRSFDWSDHKKVAMVTRLLFLKISLESCHGNKTSFLKD